MLYFLSAIVIDGSQHSKYLLVDLLKRSYVFILKFCHGY